MSNDKPADHSPSLLERIKKDSRFELTVSAESNCALVLWLLDIKQNDQVEYRLLYGWVIPYKFPASNAWWIADGGSYRALSGAKLDVKYRLPRLTLYSTGEKITQLIEYLSQSCTLEQASDRLGISKHDKFQKFASCVLFKATDQPGQLSAVTFCGARYNDAIYRGEHAYHSPSSHSPAFSVTLYSGNRENIFQHAGQTRTSQEKLVLDCLDYLTDETNFNFKEASLSRLGCIEWLEFPFMDEYEREHIRISSLGLKIHSAESPGLKITIGKYCFRQFKNKHTSLLISSRIFKDDRIALDETYEAVVDKECDFEKIMDVGFKFNRALLTIKIQLETGTWILWYEENVTIIGAISMSIGLHGGSINARADWLDNLINSKSKPTAQRLAKEAGKIDRITYMETISATSDVDRFSNIAELLKKYKLRNTETGAWFFKKGWPTDQAIPGFVQFWKWFNEKVAARTDHATVLIIDPYFDAPGITEFIARASAAQVRFVVLANTQVRSDDDEHDVSTPQSEPADPSEPIRAGRLRRACESVYYLLSSLDVRVLDLRSDQGGRGQLFHDRYIIVKNEAGEAAAGYHLSNSLQNAAKKYPLLITPIPENALAALSDYVDGLLSADPNVVSKTTIVEIFSTRTYREQLRDESKPTTDVFEILKSRGIGDSVFQASFVNNGTVSEAAAAQIRPLADILIGCTADEFPKVWLAACTWFAGDHGAHRFTEKLSPELVENFLEKLVLFLRAAPGLPIPVGTQGTPADRWLLPLANLFKRNFCECLTPADRILHHPLEQYRVGTLSVRIAVSLLIHYAPVKLFSVIENLRETLSGNALLYDNDSDLLTKAVIFYQTVAQLCHYIYFKEELTPILLASSVPLYRTLAVQRMIGTIQQNEGSLEGAQAVLAKITVLKPDEFLQANMAVCNAFVRFIIGSGKVQDLNANASLTALLNAVAAAWPTNISNPTLTDLVNRLIENPIGLEPLYEQAHKMLLMLHKREKLEINQVADVWLSMVRRQIDNEGSSSTFGDAEQCLIRITAQILCMVPMDALKKIREELTDKKHRHRRTFNGFFMSSRDFAKWYPAVRGLFLIRALAAALIAHKRATDTPDSEEMSLWVELHRELVMLLVLDTDRQMEIKQLTAYCEELER